VRLIAALLLLVVAITANAQTIKLATLAPEGSGWMNAMRAGAKEIEERTEGRVKFKFYGGGVQGNDRQVLRKMRIGQLHGGAFTSTVLGEFQRDAVLYGMPMLFNNLDEVRFARSKLDQKLRNLVEEAGYVNFGFAGGGFAHIMSVRPLSNLDDMRGLKVWVPDDDKMAYGAVKALGISPVTMPLTDVLTGLQTELIDTIMSFPAGTIVLQWNTGVNYITDLPLAYIYAMLVIDKKYFERIRPGDQAIVREVMERVYREFDEQGNQDNIDAYQALLDDGMQSVTPDAGQVPEWHKAVRASNKELAAQGVVNPKLLDEIECYIAAHRAGKQANGCK
jgi:TRAP-type C4-dicarboxylate transport system substrate-binding protein